MNSSDRRGNLLIQMFQQGDAFHLPFAFGCRGVHRALAEDYLRTYPEIDDDFLDVEGVVMAALSHQGA